MKKLKVVQLTTDKREHLRRYDEECPSFGWPVETLVDGFRKLENVEVHLVSCSQQPVSTPHQLAPNVFYHALLVPKLGWLRTGYQGCVRAARRKLRELKPDIVHGQGTERDCAISAVLSGFPNVLTIHGNMRSVARVTRARPFSYWWIAARLEALTLPRTGGVVCISSYTQRAVEELARRTWLVPNAVSEDFFNVAPRPADPPVVLCVANISFHKNQNAFIRALDSLAAERRFRLRFLGGVRENEYGREFRALVSARPWCEYGGFADRAALKRELATAHLVVLPSLEDNCPGAVLEAAAAGVPVAGAAIGGVPDLIEPGVTGELFSPLDPADMRRVVAELLAEPARAFGMAAEARAQARERFHPESVARRHVEIYREVLASAKS